MMPASLPFASNEEHLSEELRWLDLHLRLAILRAGHQRPEAGQPYISDASIRSSDVAPQVGAPLSEECELIASIDDLRAGIADRVAATGRHAGMLLLPRLVSLFELSPFEADIVTICLAREWDNKYDRLFAYLHDDATRRVPSVGLVLNLLCRSADERYAARSAFLPSGRLSRYAILQFVDMDEPGSSLLNRGLRLNEGIAHYLSGAKQLDPQVAAFCRLAPAGGPAHETPDSPLLEPFRRYLERPSSQQWIAMLSGPDRLGPEETATRLCLQLGVPLLKVDLEALIAADAGASTIPIVFREAALQGAAVFAGPVDALSRDPDRAFGHRRRLQSAMEEMGWVTFLAGRHPIELGDVQKQHMAFALHFPRPSYDDRKRIWNHLLHAADGHRSDIAVADLSARFRLAGREIRNALAMARTKAALRSGPDERLTQADLEAACREESNGGLIAFARKLKTGYCWGDLVLPRDHKSQLQEIIDHIRNHETVYNDWGFQQKHSLGKGVNVLFSGPSGTGKTMAAGIISAILGLDCYRIDLSAVVSKYIGETEKNLNRIFDEAETSNAILLFDEADALFGKRTEVKDSHDRYANIEVNYLLQKMEEHEGVVILATNLGRNLDDAFLRRMHFAVMFPFPEKEERIEVWRRVFPPEVPIAQDVDRDFLARRLKVSGGNIKNIAIGAAFLARRERSDVTMRHVVLSAKREYQKLGRLSTKAEFGDYHEIME